MTTTKNDRFLATIWVILLLAAAATPIAVHGEDPAHVCPKCSSVERGIPVLDKIPFVSRLFKKVGADENQTGAAQNFERIGIDFDFEVCPDCPQACKAGVAAGVCQSTVRPQLFMIRKTANGEMMATYGPDEPCCGKDEPCCGKECEAATACCGKGCEIICEEDETLGLSWERIVELTAANAALEASLEAQAAFHEEKSEMMESFVEIAIEKAKLEVQVEALAQQSHISKEMLALISENARLKAQVESAETRLAIVHEMAKLTMENGQLKLALQKRHSPGQLADDVQYFPASPEAKAPRTGPAKKASFQEVEPPTRRATTLEQ